jgi:hypothetical protein
VKIKKVKDFDMIKMEHHGNEKRGIRRAASLRHRASARPISG